MESPTRVVREENLQIRRYCLWFDLERSGLSQDTLCMYEYLSVFQPRYVEKTSQMTTCVAPLRPYSFMGLMIMIISIVITGCHLPFYAGESISNFILPKHIFDPFYSLLQMLTQRRVTSFKRIRWRTESEVFMITGSFNSDRREPHLRPNSQLHI